MYIQITNRCNMTCDHCGMNCTEQGEDMTLATFKKALELSDGHYITLGGGEPTIHPDFKLFLIEAIATEDIEIHCITNGKHKENARLLANLIKKEVITGAVSQDSYHEPIDPETVDLFKALSKPYLSSTIWDTSKMGELNPINAGRAKEFWDKDDLRDECLCDGLFIKPNGDVYLCGCDDSLCIGNVNQTGSEVPWIENDAYQDSLCWNRIPEIDQEAVKNEVAA